MPLQPIQEIHTVFPTQEWLDALTKKLNSDPDYARIARNWEGDLAFVIEPSGALAAPIQIYLDLWHGACRRAALSNDQEPVAAAFVLRGPYDHFVRILNGDWPPMQALLTRKLQVEGNMAYLMRHVATVLDFVRCCRETTRDLMAEHADVHDDASAV